MKKTLEGEKASSHSSLLSSVGICRNILRNDPATKRKKNLNFFFALVLFSTVCEAFNR
jgi:hypothetical protein